ncbi:MAG: MFS transporter [Actinomycetota bacterium]
MKTDRALSLWRHADFMKLWTGETISQIGTQITFLALPLTAILLLDATPFQVGLLGTFEFLPFILVGLPAGVWVDRLRRKPILIAGDLGRVIALGSIPIAYELGALHIVQLYVVAFVAGVFTVFFDVAYQSYLPSLVDRDQIVDGNAKLEISRSGAQLAGPGLAGALIQTLTAPVAILADAISYLGSALFVFLIRKKEAPLQRHGPDGAKPRMRSEIWEGLRYVLGNKLLRPIAACTATSNLFSQVAGAVILIFAVRRLGMSPGAVGLAFALGNIGFLLAAFIAPRVAQRLGIGRTIVGSAMLFGFAWFPAALMNRETAFLFLIAGMFIAGFGGTIYNINQVSLRQSITADRMQGRMNATMRFMVWGTIPIGYFVGGVLGGSIGLRPTLWVAAIGSLLAFIPPLLSPVRTLERIPDMPTEEPTVAESMAAGDDLVEPGSVPHSIAETRSRD